MSASAVADRIHATPADWITLGFSPTPEFPLSPAAPGRRRRSQMSTNEPTRSNFFCDQPSQNTHARLVAACQVVFDVLKFVNYSTLLSTVAEVSVTQQFTYI